MAKFYYAPAENAVYRVQEDCCFTRVVFGGKQIGVSAKNDQEGYPINSWDLLCYDCHDSITLLPTTEEFYLNKLYLVNALRSTRSE